MSGDRYIISDQNAVYFLTFTVVKWLNILKPHTHKRVIIDSMNYCVHNKGLTIFAWVIMPNHMHVIWQAKEGYRISDIIRDFKKFTSKSIVKNILQSSVTEDIAILHALANEARKIKRVKRYKLWYDTNHAIYLGELDTVMKDQRLDYIHNNPVKAGIVDLPEHYPYSSAIDYSGKKGLVDIDII